MYTLQQTNKKFDYLYKLYKFLYLYVQKSLLQPSLTQYYCWHFHSLYILIQCSRDQINQIKPLFYSTIVVDIVVVELSTPAISRVLTIKQVSNCFYACLWLTGSFHHIPYMGPLPPKVKVCLVFCLGKALLIMPLPIKINKGNMLLCGVFKLMWNDKPLWSLIKQTENPGCNLNTTGSHP